MTKTVTLPNSAGVYDVHSPVVPGEAAMAAKLRMFVATGILAGAPERLWVNPDCGLKTRAWEEVCVYCVCVCFVAHCVFLCVGGGARLWVNPD